MVNNVLLYILAVFPINSEIFRKCCPNGQILDIHRKICIPSTHGLSINFTAKVADVLKQETIKENLMYDVSATKCDESFVHGFEFLIAKNNSEQAGAELCQAQGKLCLVRLLLTYLVRICKFRSHI